MTGVGAAIYYWEIRVMCSGSEAGSYLRLIDSCITQLKAHQGPATRVKKKKKIRDRGVPPPLAPSLLLLLLYSRYRS